MFIDSLLSVLCMWYMLFIHSVTWPWLRVDNQFGYLDFCLLNLVVLNTENEPSL